MPKISTVAIGNELLNGKVVDTNSSYIAHAFEACGAEIISVRLVRDQADEIREALRQQSMQSDIVLTTGGLGPTSDDITQETVADFLGESLEINAESLDRLRSKYASRGRTLNENSYRQARFPSAAKIFPNPVGTADASLSSYRANDRLCFIVSLPGVPKEMKALVEQEVLPWFKTQFPDLKPKLEAHLKIFGISESYIGTQIDSLKLPAAITTAYRPRFPEVLVTFSTPNNSPDAESLLREAEQSTAKLLGAQFIYSSKHDDRLPLVVARLLTERKLTLATAESCTGGLLASELIAAPGASQYFLAGTVPYANSAKESLVKVPQRVLETHGAVSQEVAMSLARGIRFRTGADYGLSITGIAGPDGGTVEKPVGTVWIGISSEEHTSAFHHHLVWDRQGVRQYASSLALDLLRRAILGLPLTWEKK